MVEFFIVFVGLWTLGYAVLLPYRNYCEWKLKQMEKKNDR